MTTIELLKKRIKENATRELDESKLETIIITQQLIMHALRVLLEKADQPVTFDLPTEHPDIVQHVVATPFHAVPGTSQPTFMPDNPLDPDQPRM